MTDLIDGIYARGKLEDIKNILDSGSADVDYTDDGRDTALHLIGHHYTNDVEAVEIIKLLIDYGIDVNARNSKPDCFTALMIYIDNRCDIKFVETLLANGADIRQKDFLGNTALHHCANDGDESLRLSVMRRLIAKDHGLINVANKTGTTPLMHFIKKQRSVDCVKLLIDHGADVNLQDCNGNTAMHFSSSYEDKSALSLVSLLIGNFADTRRNNIKGVNPIISFVRHYANNEIIELLLNDSCGTYTLVDFNCFCIERLTPHLQRDLVLLNTLAKYLFLKEKFSEITDLMQHYYKLKFLLEIPLYSEPYFIEEDMFLELMVLESEFLVDEIQLTFQNFCLETNKHKLASYYRRYDLVSNVEQRELKFYGDILNYKVSLSKKFNEILNQIDCIVLSSKPTAEDGECVTLNYDCFKYLTEFLGDADLSSLARASHICCI